MKVYIDELKIGDSRVFSKKITLENVEQFGEITEDKNPAHFDQEYAEKTMFKDRIAHGMYVGSLFSKIFGMDFPGEGSIYLSQSLSFRKPVYFNETIKAEVIVKEIYPEKNRVLFETIATNESDEVVIKGEALIMPPRRDK